LGVSVHANAFFLDFETYLPGTQLSQGAVPMRKLLIVFTLTVSFIAALGADDYPPPECTPNCPWVR
jgi:hypothetical protein